MIHIAQILLVMFVSFNNNTKGVTSGTGTANPSGAPEFTPVFIEIGVVQSLGFCVACCRSLFSFGHSIICPSIIHSF